MSGRIRLLRGTSKQIADTTRKLDIGQPLYNIDKNYLTISSANLANMDIQPIATRYIKGWYNDAKSITETLDNNYYYFGPNETANNTHSSTLIKAIDSLDFYINGTGSSNKFITLEHSSDGSDSINLLKNTNATNIVANDITSTSFKINSITNRSANTPIEINASATMSGTLVLSRSTDISGTNNAQAALIIGSPTGSHIAIDPNEIHAKSNGTTVSHLYLNSEGGNIYFGTNTSCGMNFVPGTGINPTKTDTLSLGSSTLKWNSVNAVAVNATSITASGNISANRYIGAGVSDYSVIGSLDGKTSWSNDSTIPTLNTIAYWDGRFQTTNNSSNLAYCKLGAFGDMATKTASNYVSISGTQTISGAKTFTSKVVVNNTIEANAIVLKL